MFCLHESTGIHFTTISNRCQGYLLLFPQNFYCTVVFGLPTTNGVTFPKNINIFYLDLMKKNKIVSYIHKQTVVYMYMLNNYNETTIHVYRLLPLLLAGFSLCDTFDWYKDLKEKYNQYSLNIDLWYDNNYRYYHERKFEFLDFWDLLRRMII